MAWPWAADDLPTLAPERGPEARKMAWFWGADDLDVGVFFTVFYAALLWQACARRGQICEAAAAARRALGKLRPSQAAGAPAAADDDDEAWVREQLDELRVRGMRLATKCAFAAFAGLVALMGVAWGSFAGAGGGRAARAMLAINISRVALHGSLASGLIRVTPNRVRFVLAAMTAATIVRMLTSDFGSSDWQGGVRTVVRAWQSFTCLDARFSALLNLAWYAAFLGRRAVRRQLGLAEGVDSLELYAETGVTFSLMLLGWLAEETASYLIRLSLGELSGRTMQRAMRKVFGVLFDADVLLDPQLRVRSPDAKVVGLLAPGGGAQGAAAVEGREMADFVAPADLKRFRDLFGPANSDSATGEEAPPARSMQLQLRGVDGREFPAEVIHVQLPRLADGLPPRHLLGIRESETTCREASVPPDPHSQAFGPGAPPRPPCQWGESGAPGATNPEPLGGNAAPLSTVGTTITLEYSLEPSPIAEMELRVDASRPQMLVREFRVTFGDPQPLALKDCLFDDQFEQFWVWVQTSMNERLYGLHEAPFGALKVRWPSPSPGHDSMLLLEARSVELDYPGADGQPRREDGGETESEGQEWSEEEDGDGDGEDQEGGADQDEAGRPPNVEVVLTLGGIRRVSKAMVQPQPVRQQRALPQQTHQGAGLCSDRGEPRPSAREPVDGPGTHTAR